MTNIINIIIQFFKNIISKNNIKQLEAPKENAQKEDKIIQKNEVTQNEKKEFFEIYNKVKNGQYNLNELTEEQAKRILAILNSEITLKKDILDKYLTELNILKVDNKIEEKELYNQD